MKEKEKLTKTEEKVPNTLLKDQIKTNQHCIDFSETYQLLFGSREREESFKYQLLTRLCEIYHIKFPLTPKGRPLESRAKKECFIQGSDFTLVRKFKDGKLIKENYQTIYFNEKERFFSFDLFNKFVEELLIKEEKGFIEKKLGYTGGNKPDKCEEEFRTGWERKGEIGGEKGQRQLFFEMGKLAIESYFLTKPGLSPGTPNQAWMDVFGFNEGVCSMLRKWFWVNLLCLPEEKFNKPKEFEQSKKTGSKWYGALSPSICD